MNKLFKNIKYYYRNIKLGFKNLWYWLPIIWKDRNWDNYFIFEVLKHKLKSQADYIGSRNYYTQAQLDSKRMKICIKLIDIIQDESYYTEYGDYYENKVGTELSIFKSEIILENFDDYFKKYPRIYKKVLNGEGPFTLKDEDEAEKKRLIARNIAHINQERAFKLLFKILEEKKYKILVGLKKKEKKINKHVY